MELFEASGLKYYDQIKYKYYEQINQKSYTQQSAAFKLKNCRTF